MLVRIKILSVVTTNQHGDLMPDTELRTDAAFARHLVEDCKAAEYIDPPATASDQPKPTRKRKEKAQ